jgi:VWFA-related protein
MISPLAGDEMTLPERFRTRSLLAPSVVANLFLAAVHLGAQPLELSETIEVRVVNVDVVVTDREGRSVRGLSSADFDLLIDGRLREIDYFTAIEEDRTVDPETVTPAGAATSAGSLEKPLLVIVYDGRRMRPGESRQALGQLNDNLPDLTNTTRGVMVVRQGLSLVVEQTATRDPELLASVLGRIGSKLTPSANMATRSLLVRKIENASDPDLEEAPPGASLAEDQARALLHEIRSHAEIERFEFETAVQQLRDLVRSLSGLRGRKAILFLGRGVPTRPGELLYRLWWEKYRGIALSLGILTIETEIGIDRHMGRLIQLIEEANAHQVTFYTYDPTGLRTVGTALEYVSLAASDLTAAEQLNEQETLLALGRGTGGLGQINTSNMEPFLEEMITGFRTYYSLGFAPDPAAKDRGRIRVRVKQPGLRLRYLDRFTTRTEKPKLQERTLATLLTDITENPLDVRVELDKAERQKDGTFVVPVFIKVPIARLALLPQGETHLGQLSIAVIARNRFGELSPPALGEVPIQIENSEMLSAITGLAGYRLQLRVSAGEQRLAIGVRDEIAGGDSTLNLIVDPGQGS